MYTTKFRPTRQGAQTVVPMIKIDNFPIALKEEEKEKTLSFLKINRTYSFPSFPLLYVDLLVFQKRKRNKEER